MHVRTRTPRFQTHRARLNFDSSVDPHGIPRAMPKHKHKQLLQTKKQTKSKQPEVKALPLVFPVPSTLPGQVLIVWKQLD